MNGAGGENALVQGRSRRLVEQRQGQVSLFLLFPVGD
jgi:hypothetical protein